MKSIITFLILIASINFAQAQDKPQLILEKGKVFGSQSNLTLKQAQGLMENYPEAYDYMKKARTNNTMASIFGGIGGYLIGYPLGQAIAGGDANWGMAGVGAGVILIALPFHSAFKKNANLSIDLYNKADYKALNENVQLKIGLLENGVGLKVSF
ncbi:MAG: hypothetical protein ACJAS3_002082 [Roseivirga sp.]|jgi:hypothetical protein